MPCKTLWVTLAAWFGGDLRKRDESESSRIVRSGTGCRSRAPGELHYLNVAGNLAGAHYTGKS
ncbi:conserved protein of unknown function [Ectopseudomonas oleovorans]|uniref:Uncharacterized protein n=1 Tax=Ectopseudomonas oleovorans TaxID=301 RepID=A0A653BC50_ECTOL|nr:conserved protein of unknown function [Pseudomonas oleovorans]